MATDVPGARGATGLTVLTPVRAVRPRVGASGLSRLVWALALRESRTRYRESWGRGAWHILQPIATLVTYGFVFKRILKVHTGTLPYLSVAWCGLICWQFFQHAAQSGSTSFPAEAGSLTKVWFPRSAVPLASATAGLVDLVIGIVLLVLVALVQGITPPLTWLAAALPLLLLLVWGYAAAVVLAPLSLFVRDLGAAVPLALRIGFFATPVMYSVSTIPHAYRWLSDVNPVAVAIAGVRQTTLADGWPDWTPLLIQLAVGVIVLAAACTYLRRVENRVVDLL